MRLFIIALLSTAALAAQTRTGSISGVVTDPSDSLVPGVTVTLLNGADTVKSVQSDSQGKYQLTGIAPGVYTVRATFTGFAPFEATAYELSAGKAQIFNIALKLRLESTKVTVAADDNMRVNTDPGSNAGALVLQKSDLEALADDPDDLAADLQALAGPAAGPNGGQIFVDGFTGGRLPPKASIREIRINQNPFAAQFDRPGQGRIEILTKPGTDEFHGELVFQFSDAALNSRNPFVTSKPPYQRRQWEGEVSGPLNKKTSFFFDFERRDQNENAFVSATVLDSAFNVTPFSQPIVTPLSNVEMNFKIDRQLTTNHTLTARYTYARDENDNQGVGGFSLAARAYNVHSSEDTFQFVETGILNSRTVNEIRYRFRRQRTDDSGGQFAPIINVQDAFTSGGSPVGASYNNQKRNELQDFVSYVVRAHAIRWGAILRTVNLDDRGEQNYAGTFTFNSLDAYRITLMGLQSGQTPLQIRNAGGGASQFTLTAGNPLAAVSQFDAGLFAQDDWRIRPNFTLSAGLRYETQSHTGGWGNPAPRIGIAWAPGGQMNKSPKNVFRLGAGIFYDRLSESLTLTALRQNGVYQQQFLIQKPDFYPIVPSAATLTTGLQPQTIRETDRAWRAPAMTQIAGGYERQVAKSVTVSSTFIFSDGTHALRSRNINAPLPTTGLRPFSTPNSLYLYETSGVYRQRQWITNLNIRPSSRLTIAGFYVWGSAMSNTDGTGSFPANQYDLSSEYGRAGFDIHHRFQLNGSYTNKWGLRVSPFVTLTTGRPYNVTTGTDLNNDGLYTDRPAFVTSASKSIVQTPYGTFDAAPAPGAPIIPRNYLQGPGLIAVNLRVAKVFTLGKEKKDKSSGDPKQITLMVNARNLLNHPNYSSPDGNLTSPIFGRSNSLVSGQGSSSNRRLDLQLKFSF